ncbi:HAMP domain-containing sensor histidine kinase [Chryseobacterium sp. BIGb0232]|uniref:sensor histidine kinase n=1 Tax=Chryseobacterium sp. BIGb0232 TaxID=2940598 RepID=UPI001E3B886F|nr:HAMP domain-containing sensor histidine kinase [Chryseobacterium sp. BIGb0232]MCS4300935.1 signal transduction histidine kinase [Chryseobacterium sp. BIGb0232]
MDNGLPQNSVKDIIKDKYGYLWLSTEDGIVRYDGVKFEHFNNFPLPNLNFEYFRGDISKDSIAIFGSNPTHPVIIKNRKPVFYMGKGIEPLMISHNNSLYVKINKNLFFEGGPSYFQTFALNFKNSRYYFNQKDVFYNNKSASLDMPSGFNSLKSLPYIFADHEHVFIIDKKRNKIITIYHGEVSETVTEDLILYDKDTKIYWQQLSNQTFLINKNNIYRVYHKNNKIDVEFLTRYETFDTDQIQAMFYDEQYKKLYLGSSTKGFNILPINGFYTSKNTIEYADNVFYSTLPYGKNSVITPAGTVYTRNGLIENKHFEKIPYKMFLLYDDQLNIFYKKYSTIIKRSKKSGYKEYDSIPSKRYLKAVNSFDKKIVVTYNEAGGKNFFTTFDENGKKESEVTLHTQVAPEFIGKFDPAFYLLQNGTDLLWFSIKKQAVTFSIKLNIGLKQIQKIQNDVYLLTTFKNGLYILKNKKLLKLPLDPEKKLATAHIFLEDSKGNFWISSNDGLYKVRKKHILDFIENKRKNVFYYRYTKEDGLVNNEFNGTCFKPGNKLENGEFVFSSMEGLVFFKPDEIQSVYPNSEDLYLERAKTENKIVSFKNKLVLPADYKNAEILLDIPYYGNLENINLEYTIDDKNSQWKRVTNKAINLVGLSYGKHDITVRMLVSPDGNFTYKKISVEVEPQFYQTIWFRILSVSSLLLLILVIVHSRTRFLKSKNIVLKKTVIKKAKELDESLKNLQENQQKLSNQSEYEKKIIENIIHDITTPVRFIALISQQLTDATDPETQKEYFESLHASSEQLHKYTLNLKDYTQMYKEDTYYEDEYYSLAEIINEKRLLFHKIALHNNTIITNETDNDIKINIKKSVMNMILHNLIDNSVKNTFDGFITISGTLHSNKEIIINIKDTGNGMQSKDIEYYNNLFSIHGKISDSKFKSSLGLYLISQVSKKINMNITFTKNKPQGTSVELIIKP